MREKDCLSDMNKPVPPAEKAQDSTPGTPMFRGGSKVVALSVILILALTLIYATPLRSVLTQIHKIDERLEAFGWAAPAVFVGAVAGLVAVGCPRLLLCPIGGLAFGFFWGLLWAQIGAIIGSYGTFLFVRWAGRDFVLRKWPRLERRSRMITEKGALPVLLIRQIPVSGLWINSLLGLTHVRHRDFFLGTAIGFLPEAIPATLVGASATQLSLGKGVAYVLMAIVWFVMMALVVRWYRRSARPSTAKTESKALEEMMEAGNAAKNGR